MDATLIRTSITNPRTKKVQTFYTKEGETLGEVVGRALNRVIDETPLRDLPMRWEIAATIVPGLEEL